MLLQLKVVKMLHVLTYLFGINSMLEVWSEESTMLNYETIVTDILLEENVTRFPDIETNYGRLREEENETALNIKDEYEDRIKIIIYEGVGFRSATSDRRKIWENGIVPFVITNDYRSQDRVLIREAMREFRNNTCIRFRRRRNEASYIRIMPGRRCQAGVGKPTRVNRVLLARECLSKGIIMHELMHTLGFFHEHTRPDRDQFVRVIFNNIIRGAERNFAIIPASEIDTLNVSYDYGSILHYGTSDFARDRTRPTLVPLQQGVEIGQRRGFSERDIQKINLLYNCSELSANGTQNRTALDNDFEVVEEADDDGLRFYRFFFTIDRFPSIFGSIFRFW